MSVHYDTSNPRRARHPRDGIANIIRRQAFTIRINNEYAEATIAKISGNHPTPCGWFDRRQIVSKIAIPRARRWIDQNNVSHDFVPL